MKQVLVLATALASLCATAASAAPMKFEYQNTGGNHCCWWIQADGEIVPGTPAAFEAFYHSLKYPPDTVRLNSLGGNLAAGVALGEKMRALGLSTEVGSTWRTLFAQCPSDRLQRQKAASAVSTFFER
jgi:hypothetical protein